MKDSRPIEGRGGQGGTYGRGGGTELGRRYQKMGRGIQMGVALLSLVCLSACGWLGKNPSGPTQTVTVVVNQTQGQTPQPSPSPGLVPDQITLRTIGDDYSLIADGEDDVILVVTYFLKGAKLEDSQTGSFVPEYHINGPCTNDGDRLTSASPGSCQVTASYAGVTSAPRNITATAVP